MGGVGRGGGSDSMPPGAGQCTRGGIVLYTMGPHHQLTDRSAMFLNFVGVGWGGDHHASMKFYRDHVSSMQYNMLHGL